MRRDTRAEIEGHTIKMIARARRTIRAALLQADEGRIAVVPAARALREIAAERRQVPDLRRGEALRGSGEAGIGRCEAAIGRDVGDRRERTDICGAVLVPGRSERSVPAARNSGWSMGVAARVMRRRSP
jgi:plasmid stability protein